MKNKTESTAKPATAPRPGPSIIKKMPGTGGTPRVAIVTAPKPATPGAN